MLAVEKARRLAREGFDTLLTCASQPLAEHLRECRRPFGPLPGRIEIHTFADLCTRAARDGGLETLPACRPGSSLPAAYPEALERAAAALAGYQFDAVLVDEGQDFEELWWVALERCLKDGRDGILYVFFDDNQRLRTSDLYLPADLVPFHLNENVRNTRAIYRLLQQYYSGGESVPSGPAGRPEELVQCPTPADLPTTLGTVLRRLLHGEGLRADALVIVTPRPREESALRGLALGHGLRLVERPDPRGQSIYWCPVDEFKGLERDVVLVAELEESLLREDATRRDAVCYVAFSRPRHHLVLIGPAEVLEALRPRGRS
jgi:hypothetical protein